MKKGFTLLELIVVIIIIGILATLGLTQYGRIVERSRGAEARAIIGDLRKFAYAIRLERGVLTLGLNVTSADVGIGTLPEQIPDACRTSHFFRYSWTIAGPLTTFTATRCTAGGKIPQSPTDVTLTLESNLLTGVDTSGGTGGY